MSVKVHINEYLSRNLFCLKTKKFNYVPINRPRKWTIYIIGLLETFVFSGCIFGWAQLVYVLKNEEIFLDLCWNTTSNYFNATEISEATKLNVLMEDIIREGCPEQDKKFALIFTIGCIFYSGTAMLSGFAIHHFGLVVARILATLTLSGGFFALGLLSKENTYWLYVSVILLSYGGNQLRLSGFQFCNLFPESKSTALTIISGSYSASAGLFLVFQAGQNKGVSLWFMSLCLAVLALLSMLASAIMPWHHIPYDQQSNQLPKLEIPFRNSLLSLSTGTYMLWFVSIVFSIRFYNISYNSWVSKISSTNDEAGVYSYMFSFSFIISLIITPVPGMINDYLLRRAKASAGSNQKKYLENELLSPVLTLSITLLVTMVLTCCLLFHNYVAIYVSLFMLIVLNPSMISVGADFIRIRFPPEHFDRLNGICGTFASLFAFVQYPFFLWAQNNPKWAIGCLTFVLITALIHPLHLLSKSYRKKVANERFQKIENIQRLIKSGNKEKL